MKKLSDQAHSWKPSVVTSSDLNERKTQIAKLAGLLLGCYRTGDANDPAIYSGAVIAVLSDYPMDVIEQVVDPRSGLPSRTKWLPTVAEIKEACEEIERPQRRRADIERQINQQLDERKLLEAPRHNRPTYDELITRCVAAGLDMPGRPKKGPTPEDFCEKFNISREQFDAIPDAK